MNGGGETTKSTPKIVKIGPSDGNGQFLHLLHVKLDFTYCCVYHACSMVVLCILFPVYLAKNIFVGNFIGNFTGCTRLFFSCEFILNLDRF